MLDYLNIKDFASTGGDLRVVEMVILSLK